METKTLHIRIKGNTNLLKHMSRDVNLVWNFCNETSAKAWKRDRRWLSAFDMASCTSGGTKHLCIGSATIQAIGEEHAIRRKQFKKCKLRWRTRKSLGWIPFKTSQIKFRDGCLKFNGKKFKAWDSYGLENYELRTGNFSQDSMGKWYVNMTVKFEPEAGAGRDNVGIDLGLKDAATMSDGTVLENHQYYRELEEEIGKQQRARNKNRVRKLHTKVKSQRKDFLHKASRLLVNSSKKIAVGNVSSSKLVKTRMAKSVLDVGWSMLKTMIEYKSRWASIELKVVDEAYSTQTCSNCGCISGPKGLEGLGIRHWECRDCGAHHQRDVNAARNIFNAGFGHEPLAVGIPVL